MADAFDAATFCAEMALTDRTHDADDLATICRSAVTVLHALPDPEGGQAQEWLTYLRERVEAFARHPRGRQGYTEALAVLDEALALVTA